MVRTGTIGTAGHNDEVHAHMTGLQDGVTDELPCLCFRDAGSQDFRDTRVHVVNRRSSLAKSCHLPRVLAHPHRSDHGLRESLFCMGHGSAECQHLLRPHVVVQTHS